MSSTLKTILLCSPLALLFAFSPSNAGHNKAIYNASLKGVINTSYVINSSEPTTSLTKEALIAKADKLYDSLALEDLGLNKHAFEYAWRGYQYLVKKGKLYRNNILSICDFSQSSSKKRLYIIDMANMKVLLNTYVAHGRNSGGEYANSFSNRPESRQSSLGFYVTRDTYYGEHGLSLKIDGVEKGFNDKANNRKIVVHGCEYLGPDFLRQNPFNGRSYGCPAIPSNESPEIINLIKNGTCLFIYHPTKKYLTQSKILNG